MSDISTRIQSINRNAAETSAAVRQIAAEIAFLDKRLEAITGNSSEVKTRVDALSRLSADLDKLVIGLQCKKKIQNSEDRIQNLLTSDF